jgi:RNA recognition motif-containing protein
MTMKLYVGNLAFSTSSQDLQELFGQAGTVESASVVEDRDTGRSRGFGFVEMSSKEEGEAAIAQFNGKEVNGRSLTVNEAKPRENRAGGGGGRTMDVFLHRVAEGQRLAGSQPEHRSSRAGRSAQRP